MLDDVERRPLCRQHRPRFARQRHQMRATRLRAAFCGQNLNAHIGIQMPEKGRCNWQARNNNCITAVHHARKACVRGDHTVRRDIAARRPQILRQSRADKGIKIKMGEVKRHSNGFREAGSGGS